MRERLQNVARELLPAIGYGDAAGFPVETKNADYIDVTYGYITTLQPSTNNPFYGGEREAGCTSDDTQLSQAVADSILEEHGFTLASQAKHHLQAYWDTPRAYDGDKLIVRGWGGSTTNSMQRLENGVPPEQSGEVNGSGNGIIMKMAPLAVWQALADIDVDTRKQQYDALTSMTHDSDLARLCTTIHGEVFAKILATGDLSTIPAVVHEIVDGTSDFTDETTLLLRAVDDPCANFDELVERYAKGKSGFKYGFYVPETIAIVYDIALGSGGDFETAVYRAVNLGGDSDSTASTLASMIVCASGGEYTKPRDMDSIENIKTLYETSHKLAQIVA